MQKSNFTCGKMRRNVPIFSIADELISIFVDDVYKMSSSIDESDGTILGIK